MAFKGIRKKTGAWWPVVFERYKQEKLFTESSGVSFPTTLEKFESAA